MSRHRFVGRTLGLLVLPTLAFAAQPLALVSAAPVPAKSPGKVGVRLLTADEEKALDTGNPKAAFKAAAADDVERKRERADFVRQNPESKEADGAVTVKSGGMLPKKFSWVDHGMVTPIKDQTGPTCWAFAYTGVLESAYLMRHREVIDLYEQDLINCSCRKKDTCGGPSPNDSAAKELAGLRLQGSKENLGDGLKCTVSNCGRCMLDDRTPYHLEFTRVPVNPEYDHDGEHYEDPAPTNEMKRALLEHGPLSVKMHIPDDSTFMDNNGAEVFKETLPLVYEPKRTNGAHIVNIVGWDDAKQAWHVKNSWGTDWRDDGFAWVKYGSNKIGMVATWARAWAPSHRVTAVWHKSKVAEKQVHGWTRVDFLSKDEALRKKGYRLHILETSVENGHPRYSAVWRKGEEVEKTRYGQTYAEYQKKYDELWDEGWRIHLLATSVVDGKVRYDAVWRKGTNGETQHYGLSYGAYQKKYDALWKQGKRIHILNQYVVDGKVKYDAIWRSSEAGEMQFYEMTFAEYKKKADDLAKDGWRLYVLDTFRKSGKLKYSAVWRKTGVEERKIYGWNYDAFRAEDAELREKGWRLDVLDPV